MQKLVTSGSVVCGLSAATKKQILQEMAQLAAPIAGVGEHAIFDVLLERERLGTTGVGHGIAIPHGKVPGIAQVCGFFARLEKPVTYEAVDDLPVDLVFMLLAPVDAGADHLKALAHISRLLRNPATCARLRAAQDSAALYEILTSAQAAETAA